MARPSGRWHFEHDETREILAEALRIVDELRIGDELREQAFVQAVGLLSRKTIEAMAPVGAARILGGRQG